jgi:hypothetical protein
MVTLLQQPTEPLQSQSGAISGVVKDTNGTGRVSSSDRLAFSDLLLMANWFECFWWKG